MCKKLICLVSFVVPVLSLISNAQAGEATADTFVRGAGNGDTNYGSNSNVTIKNANGNSYDRKAYIRFDIAGATAEASLDLTVAGNNEGGGGTTPQTFTVEVYGLAESLDHTWTENDITWNNAPANDTSSSNFTADATLLGSFIVEPLPVGNIVSFSDPALVDFINSDTDNQITILLRRTTGNSSHNLGFASKENTSGYSAPTLNAGPIPQASGPSPADEVTDVSRDVVLSWTSGKFAPPVNGHIVYLSDNFGDVNDGIGGITQDASSYAPSPRLDLGTTYYWRVDEVNAPPTSHIEFKGEVWQFTVEPIAYLIPAEKITVTASSASEGMGPENTINGSGLDVSDLHSIEPADMWLSSDEPNGAWIEYELDKVHKLHEMWVWNSNQVMEPMIGLGFKDVTIEYSVDGNDYAPLGITHEFVRAPGTPNYAYNTTVDFGSTAAKYVRLTANSNWGGILDQYGLSEVRFFDIPVFAREPSPDSGTTEVAVDVTLGFRAGREAVTHDVYLSSDEQAVIDGNVPVTTVTEASYGPLSLDLGTTYYWKINEVNEAETTTTWQGEIWNFSTPEFFVVEDFEDYNDYPPDEIWATWVDGYGVPENGATSGYPDPDFLAGENYAETAIVHGGDQSMPLFYDNSTADYSEATVNVANLQVGQDWTKHGIKALTLRFFGDPNNAVEQMYVKVNGSKVTYDGDAENIRRTGWQMWYIDLADFGPDLSNVTELSIGFERSGAFGGQGVVYFDGIRLYSYDRQVITPVEAGTISLEAHYEFESNTNDSSGNGRHGTAMGNPVFVAGKVGQAISLDGIDDYVNIDGYKGILADANGVQHEFTLAAWIKTTDNGEIITWGSSPGGQRMTFRVDTVIRVEHGNGNIRGTGGPDLRDNQWHHVAATLPRGARMMDVLLYVDGFDVTPNSTDEDPFILTGDADVSIGRRATSDDRYFTGSIDDARIYDRVLSPEEAAWLGGRTMPFDKPF